MQTVKVSEGSIVSLSVGLFAVNSMLTLETDSGYRQHWEFMPLDPEDGDFHDPYAKGTLIAYSNDMKPLWKADVISSEFNQFISDASCVSFMKGSTLRSLYIFSNGRFEIVETP